MKITIPFACFCICLMLVGFLFSTPSCLADDDWEENRHFFEKHGRKAGLVRQLAGECDNGDETTGQVAAWSFAAANLTVALSLLAGIVRRFIPLNPSAQEAIGRFNRFQKKHLMTLHYFLNPVILCIALLHWSLSRCKSTALPEWGILTMGAIIALGVILKFKLCPKTLVRNIRRVHTQPVLFLILISMLVFGHLAVD